MKNEESSPPLDEPNNESKDSMSEARELREMNEQLLQANEELRAESALARQELAAVSPLRLSFGSGVLRTIVNARSIQSIGLQQESEPNPLGGSILHDRWAVLVDARRISDYLPAQEAVAALARIEQQWAEATDQPSR